MKFMRLSTLSLGLLAASSQLHATELFTHVPADAGIQSIAAEKDHVANLIAVKANIADISTAKSLTIPLENGLSAKFDRDDFSVMNTGSQLWQGTLSGLNLMTEASEITAKAANSAMLVNRDGKITGTVQYRGQLYRIKPGANGSHLVEKVDVDKMPPDHAPEFYQEQGALAFTPAQEVSNLDMTQAVADTDIKVLVAYTSRAASQSGNINGIIDLAIAETNQGYQNSGITGSVTMVHKYQVNYTEASNSSTDLNRIAAKNDGYMDEVHGLRDQYGADVVLLVSDVNGYCGQADAIMATESSAFAIVDWDCATGYYSTGHEIGHLQGARHDPAADPTSTPYSYGHGYRHPGADWRTVMAYNCSPSCTRINWWSNPDNRRNGDVMGTTSTSDNSRVLDQTIPVLAGFRGDGTGGGSGGSDSGSTSNISKTSGNWHRESVATPASVTFTASISGGSGDADLYVRKGAAPTDSSYDCRPYRYGNSETCTVSVSSATDVHIGIKAYSTYSGVTLNWSYN